MEKTYKFELPQSKEVASTNVRVENGEMFVDVEFKERFEPKDGDFVITDMNEIYIYNTNYTTKYCGLNGFYAGISVQNGIVVSDGRKGFAKAIRYATPEEKSAFLERLEKECGKRWNADTKQLEDIRWKPKHRETYWYVDEKFTVLEEIYSKYCNYDANNVEVNNCFRSKEAAQKVADQIKEIFKNSKAE